MKKDRFVTGEIVIYAVPLSPDDIQYIGSEFRILSVVPAVSPTVRSYYIIGIREDQFRSKILAVKDYQIRKKIPPLEPSNLTRDSEIDI